MEGDGLTRGQAYGEGARDLIVESAERLVATLSHALPIDVGEYLALLTESTGFRETARRLTPDVMDEVDGIAAGSGVDARTVFALNLLDEEWWFRSRFVTGTTPTGACSSFGMRPPAAAETIIGQNMDLPNLQGVQVLLDIRPHDGPRVLAPSYAGMINTNAMNEHGLGICVNTLPQLASSPTGLPVAFVVRAVAGATRIEDAIELLTGLPHASGQNYILGSESGIACFECGAHGASEYGDRTRIGHTNHPLAQRSEVAAHGEQPAEVWGNSEERFACLQGQIAECEMFDVHTAQRVLSTMPILRGGPHDSHGATFYGVIMLPARRSLLLSDGSPTVSAFREYRFQTALTAAVSR